jgi:hypothetical protein
MNQITNTIKKSAPLLMGLLLLVASSCTEDNKPDTTILDGSTSLILDARFGDVDFELNKVFQVTSDGESFNFEFSKLRYWVSNVVLVKAEGGEFKVPNSFYLVEETNEIPVQDGTFGKVYPAKKREEIILANIPAGDYSGIKFHIGVEQKYNDNLTLTAGELNPLNGMASDSWMWFTSYIFTSTSGKITKQSDATQSKNFFWETGSNELYTEKTVTFDQPITINSTTNSTVNLKLDVRTVVNVESPWDNSVIGAGTPTLMHSLKSNYVNAISLASASSIARN